MITYVRNNIEGYYAEFPQEIDAAYWQGKIGTTYEDFVEGKWVKLSEQQAQYHIDHPEASVLEVIEIGPSPRTLEQAKEEKLKAINEYDSSDAVNVFYVFKNDLTPQEWEELLLVEKEEYKKQHTISDWLTPSERSNYRSSIDAAELVDIENLSLYIGEMPITVPTQSAKMMLAQIQLYADQCFIVTKQHEATVEALNTIEAVDGYDITQGYPEKLTFNV